MKSRATGHLTRFRAEIGLLAIIVTTTPSLTQNQNGQRPLPSNPTTVAQLVSGIRAKAKNLESSTGMRQGFQSFTSTYKLPTSSVSYSDFVVARLLFEATRDAGFWNLHWTITDREPKSDEIWRQWKTNRLPSLAMPTATAECDELSALYAFLMERSGVHGVGLLWPYPNHTVAVWVIPATGKSPVRVVVPTTQIFLGEEDSFGTKKFDPWRQKSIHPYVRRDVPDSFELPGPLFSLFLLQIDKYAGATEATLQRIRYLRDGVFRGAWSSEAAAREALKRRDELAPGSREDIAAFQNFALDMRSGLFQ